MLVRIGNYHNHANSLQIYVKQSEDIGITQRVKKLDRGKNLSCFTSNEALVSLSCPTRAQQKQVPTIFRNIVFVSSNLQFILTNIYLPHNKILLFDRYGKNIMEIFVNFRLFAIPYP